MPKIVLSKDLELLIPKFLNSRKIEIEEMEKALIELNFDKIKEVAHKTKGAAGGYGFEEISKIAESIENNILNLSKLDISALINYLKTYFEELEIEYIDEDF